jgi:hypothetical protein
MDPHKAHGWLSASWLTTQPPSVSRACQALLAMAKYAEGRSLMDGLHYAAAAGRFQEALEYADRGTDLALTLQACLELARTRHQQAVATWGGGGN